MPQRKKFSEDVEHYESVDMGWDMTIVLLKGALKVVFVNHWNDLHMFHPPRK